MHSFPKQLPSQLENFENVPKPNPPKIWTKKLLIISRFFRSTNSQGRWHQRELRNSVRPEPGLIPPGSGPAAATTTSTAAAEGRPGYLRQQRELRDEVEAPGAPELPRSAERQDEDAAGGTRHATAAADETWRWCKPAAAATGRIRSW